ncbi:glycosyltransferase family 4 protein [Methylorubrum extorquens]|uniref:glycosyltransferase family 4 protein n=1 Tax=Methylorubrum extorquens TaxID=408 RepID=UPI00209C800C|nr:glycosyltransferase family 4 protein [Methylorubrum extorquens]MCP1538835.1 glycosyltransferase involved in cell wall biosynthesis [Methylorubrum extorquens]
MSSTSCDWAHARHHPEASDSLLPLPPTHGAASAQGAARDAACGTTQATVGPLPFVIQAEEARSRWCFFSPGFRSLDVLLGDSRSAGGAEAQVAYLARALVERGHEVTMIYGEGAKPTADRTVAGVTCIDAAPAWRRPASLARFWRTIGRLRPDRLYARLPGDFLWLMGLYARMRPGSRFVYALAHDSHADARTAYDHRRWFHAPLFGLGLRSAHVIAVQHRHQAARVSMVTAGRLTWVPNLVRRVRAEPRPFLPAVIDVVWVAKIRHEKRLDLFLNLARSLPRMRFAVVGGFDPTVEEQARIHLMERMAMLANVEWLGALRADDVIDCLARSRVLVNTSDREGFPNTMLEAWSMGVPVVSLRVDPGDVIREYGLGRVSGSIEILCEDVLRLAVDARLNRILGENGLAYVRRWHGSDAVCAALDALATGPGGWHGRPLAGAYAGDMDPAHAREARSLDEVR